ncbi:ABC transporter ATP-binding protein [Dictyobacter formicarum]|uniref:ABC transporter ATP-binding protein n=1 Tax=Dictyobacter formicarum TaxID=2778368 RepID=A0ABQ3VDP3_9CHLR|nr:nitrate/sulfonate/bicarbonate ABC transporter ATP-binding protein [Dictyobacter formicarum]GHO83910.1 ABC transporter ATP-binding protein [Dictyobacter formicarum]
MANFNIHAGETLLETCNVKKIYDMDGKRPRGVNPPVVLEDIDLKINAGEFVALLGPSGSGKSTLLRILAGLLRPTEGQVLFKGVPQHRPNPHLSIVFQTFALFPWLTVLQNVELGLEAQEVPPTQRMRRSLAAIDTIGLDGFEDAYPKELSGGMRQRVGFARALVVEPELLFMDEPFSALDVLTAANLRKELLSLWHEHKIPTRAILMVTHNIDDAVLMADRIVVLGANPGIIRVELSGLPMEQRDANNANYTKMVDLIYRIMTSPQADISTLMPQEKKEVTSGKLIPPKPQPYQVLPHVAISDVTGLLELVHSKGDREDLYQLGRDLQLEVDDLLPMVDAAHMLGFAEAQEGDLILTETGKRFAEAGVLEEKDLFRQQAIKNVTMLRHIVRALAREPGHTLPEERFLSELHEHFSDDESWSQLETAINWGRYAELFSYQEERGVFRLEEPETVAALVS